MSKVNIDILYPLHERDQLCLEASKPYKAKSSVWIYFGVFDEDKHPALTGHCICYKCLTILKNGTSTSSLHTIVTI